MCRLAIGLLLLALPVLADADTDTNSKLLRDPTTPLGSQSLTRSGEVKVALHLNSILISSQRKIAIVNGQTVRQGEEVKGSGFHIVSIKTNSVTLQSANDTQVLSLTDSKVKK